MNDPKIKITHVIVDDDGNMKQFTQDEPISKHMNTIARIPKIWAHKHYRGEERLDYDPDMRDVCEICKGIFEEMVDNSEACEKHPGAYVEPPTKEDPAMHCEECDPDWFKGGSTENGQKEKTEERS